jgi:hypothetical protein
MCQGYERRYTSGLSLEMLTDTELREVEREVERHLRPFACGVGIASDGT